MNLFGLNFLSREAPQSRTSAKSEEQKTTSGATWQLNIKGATTPNSSLNVSVAYRCADIISDSVAMMTLQYKRYSQKDDIFVPFVQYDRDRLHYLLNVRPNARQNAFVFKKNIVMRMLLTGNAIVVPVSRNGIALNFAEDFIDHLVLITADAGSSGTYNVLNNTYTFCDLNQGVPMQTVPASHVLHFKNTSSDGGFWGESVISHAFRSLNMLATADDQVLKNTASGGRFKAILSGIGAAMTIGSSNRREMGKAAQDIADDIATKDIITLPDKNLELKPLSISAAEQQLLENRKLAREDVARFFGVPLFKLGIISSNYKSIDAAQVDYYQECVQPRLSQIECELMCKYTTPENFMDIKFDFDETPLFQLDADAKAKRLKSLLESGIKSVNDLRKEMDIAPVKDGDVILMSANLKSITTLKTEATATVPPASAGGTDNTNPQNPDNDD